MDDIVGELESQCAALESAAAKLHEIIHDMKTNNTSPLHEVITINGALLNMLSRVDTVLEQRYKSDSGHNRTAKITTMSPSRPSRVTVGYDALLVEPKTRPSARQPKKNPVISLKVGVHGVDLN